MYKVLNLRSVRSDYFIRDENIFFRDENHVLKFGNQTIDKIYLCNEKFVLEDVQNEYLYVRNKESFQEYNFKSNIISKEFKFLDHRPKQLKSITSPTFIVGEKNHETWNLSEYNFNGNLEWQLTFKNPVLIKKLTQSVIIFNRELICLKYNYDNACKWNFNLNDGLICLSSSVVTLNEYLFFVDKHSEDKNDLLICLSLNEGKIIKQFVGNFYDIFEDGKHLYTSKYNNILCRINPITLEMEEWNVGDILKENNFFSINDHRCAAKEGKFYFTQSIGDKKAKLGILEFEAKALIYKYEFNPENGGVSSIKLEDERIFVHMQDMTLYIFEEEISSTIS